MTPDKDYDRSIALGELKHDPTAAIEVVDDQHSFRLARSYSKHSVLYFSCMVLFGKHLVKAPRLHPEDLWEYRELQRHAPIQVTTEDDMEWWWFEDEFYQTRFVKGCPSQCLREQLFTFASVPKRPTKWTNIKTTYYSLDTTHEVEASHNVDGEVTLVPKYTLDGGTEDTELGYSPHEVAQAVFELRDEKETKAQRSKRLRAFFAIDNQQYQQWIKNGQKTKSGERERKPIPKNVKMYVWQRDQGRCVECGSNERLEYDHIIPISKGGSNTERNIQLLCEHCNRSKGTSIK